jgi:hypothetical protein
MEPQVAAARCTFQAEVLEQSLMVLAILLEPPTLPPALAAATSADAS